MSAHNLPVSGAPDGAQLEIEWQFDALDLRPVESWLLGGHPFVHVTAAPRGSKELHDTYFDTDDWRFHRAGYALRVRQAGGTAEATLKSLEAAAEGEARRRREISQKLDLEGVIGERLTAAPGPVADRARLIAGPRPIRPLFEIHNHRRKIELALDGVPAGEVALDDTAVPVPGGQEPLRLRRVEVEVPAEMVAGLKPFVEAMRAACGLQPAALSKYEAGLLALGLKPASAPDFGPTEIDASQALGQVAFAVMRRHFAAFLLDEPGTRLGDDPEALHDMRVAARRLRAAMRLFEAALPARADRLREELRWIAGALGEVRDLDVQLEQVRAWSAEVEPDDRAALASLAGLVEERRERARRQLLRALDSRRYERLVAGFGPMLRRGPPRRPAGRSPAARAPVVEAAPPLIARRYDKVHKLGSRIGVDATPEAYHALRIQCKRLRYALEFFRGIYGKPAESMIARLVALQDLLGQHQDAYVAIGHLRALAAHHGRRLSPQALFVMGGLAQRYAQQAATLRAQFPEAFQRFKGRPWKRLQRAMEQIRHAARAAGQSTSRKSKTIEGEAASDPVTPNPAISPSPSE